MTSLTPLKDSNVCDLCSIFHVSRSGYYASLDSLSYMEKMGITHEELAGLFYWIILIRQPHILPKAGWRQLYILCKKHPDLQKMGQNRFKEFLRINNLMLESTRKTHPRTTFTGEGWQKYSDLLNLEDGRFAPSHAGELLVCDITYVPYSIDLESGEQKAPSTTLGPCL